MQLSTTMTKFQLLKLLTTSGTASVILPDGRPGIVESIKREDNSGCSFILNINLGWSWAGGKETSTFHVKTID